MQGEIALVKKAERPSVVDLDRIIKREQARNKHHHEKPKPKMLSHIDFILESFMAEKSLPKDKKSSDEAGMSDAQLNQEQRVFPGRLTLNIRMLLYLTD